MPYQGKRLDGRPYEDPDFDPAIFKDKTRERKNRNQERVVDVHFDGIWFADRLARGALGLSDELRKFMKRWLLFEIEPENDAVSNTCRFTTDE